MKVTGVGNNDFSWNSEVNSNQNSTPSIWLQNGNNIVNQDRTDLEITLRYQKAKKAYEEGIKGTNTPEGHRQLEQEYLEAEQNYELIQ